MSISKTIKFTESELNLLYFIVNTNIEWEKEGCLVDFNTDQVDEEKMKIAKKILAKL